MVDATRQRTELHPIAWRPLLLVSSGVMVLLVALSGRYGYHRDELYFLQAGRHLDWGYPDQPPLAPALARLVDAIAPDSLLALRIPAALAAGAMVLLTGLLARELGGARNAQLLAAACWAVSAVLLVTGHMFGTTVLDLLAWTAISWIAARLLRGADPAPDGPGARSATAVWWLALGAVTGLGLQNKSLLVVLPVALLVGVLIAGPRAVLRTPWLAAGVGIAGLLVLPNLIWQAANGWPQLTLSTAIAAGESGTSEPRWLFLPFQLVLVSPAIAPLWIAGLVALFRSPRLARFRAFGWAYGLLAVVFLIAGGKPYYLAGLYPVLLAAGATVTVDWLRRRSDRRVLVGSVLGLSLLFNAVLMLPVLPVGVLGRTPVVAVNYDAGETVGWPAFATTVAAAADGLPADERAQVVLLTGNYGEAGALDRFGPALGLPPAFSGHNAYHDWGPPPEEAGRTTIVAVGISRERLETFCRSVEPVGEIDSGVDVDNDEQGSTVWLCRDRTAGWAEIWPSLRRLG